MLEGRQPVHVPAQWFSPAAAAEPRARKSKAIKRAADPDDDTDFAHDDLDWPDEDAGDPNDDDLDFVGSSSKNPRRL